MGNVSAARNWHHPGSLEGGSTDAGPTVDELRAMLAKQDAQGARRLVKGLIQRSEREFRSEQALLRRHGFPRLHEHARRHESALLLLERLDACVASGRFAGAAVAYDDLCSFLDGIRSRHEAEYIAFLSDASPRDAQAYRR